MSENEEFVPTSNEMTSYFILSIPIICNTITIAIFTCGISFIVSAVLKAIVLRIFGTDENKSLKRKRLRSNQSISARELNNLLNQDTEEECAENDYFIRRTRSGCAYGVYHIKKTGLLPEVGE